jgi:hypothetical protein
VITDNQIFGPRNDGIVIAATAGSISDVVISGNMIAMANPAVPPIQDTSLPGCGIALIGDLLDGPALGAVTNVRICDNEIRQSKGSGISLKGNVDNSSARFDVLNNAVFDSGTQRPDGSGSNAPGIVVDHIKGFMVSSNRSQDTRSSKTQTYGLTVDNAAGNNLVHGNDLTDNINSGVGGAATGYKSADNLGVEL